MQVTVTGDGDHRTLTRVSVYSLVAVYPSIVITFFLATNPESCHPKHIPET